MGAISTATKVMVPHFVNNRKLRVTRAFFQFLPLVASGVVGFPHVVRPLARHSGVILPVRPWRGQSPRNPQNFHSLINLVFGVKSK